MNASRYRIGTSGWSYPHWRGSFYPQDLARSRWFAFYAGHFDTVEVNATFYRRFKPETYRHWGEKAPAGFRYVFKVPRLISHRKRLHDCQDLIEEFTGSVALTGDRFGLALLQLPPGLHQDLPRLETALRAFGDPRRVAVEFRHPSWLKADTRDLLERLGSSFVATDSPQGRPLDWLTGDYGYIRLHGRTRWYDYDYAPAEIEEIAALAEDMVARGAREVYVFFNNDTAAYAPGNAQALRVRLDAGRSGHSDG